MKGGNFMKKEWEKPVLDQLSVSLTKGKGHGGKWWDDSDDSGDDNLGS